MTLRITATLRHIGDNLAVVLSPQIIREVCSLIEHRWRDRILDPVTTIRLFVLQILHANTACTHLARLTGLTFSDSAYCQARAQLPLALLERLLERVSAALRPLTDQGR